MESHHREHVCWLHVCPRQQSKGEFSDCHLIKTLFFFLYYLHIQFSSAPSHIKFSLIISEGSNFIILIF